jgi:NAD(P)-dependent dehydrogenase (short-subunit alcohol dehydrogenase family)
MRKLEGKIALLIGVDKGIDLTIIKQFIYEGAYVFFAGHGDSELTTGAETLGCNLIDLETADFNGFDLPRLFSKTERASDKLDIVYLNAGVAGPVSFGDISDEDFQTVFDADVKKSFFTIRRLLPQMSDGASVILNLTVREEHSRNSILIAATFAMRSLAKTLIAELKHRRIRLNAVNCNHKATTANVTWESIGKAEYSLETSSNKSLPGGRPSTIESVADVVLSLCDENNDVTGAEVTMDRGMAHMKMLSDELQIGARMGTPDEVASNAVFLASDLSRHVNGYELFADGNMAEL